MEFHMYAQTACTVADCITLLLSRKAKLKGENPPPAKPCISIFSHGPRIGVRQISVFVCQTPTFSPCAVSLIVIPLLTLLLFVLFITFLHLLSSVCFSFLQRICFLAHFLFVCLLPYQPVLVLNLSVCHLFVLPILSYLCSSTGRHNTHPIII